MKNMRKLIPAIAMLLVSAVMMSTASFAWFSVATRASVDGIEVKATASGGIAIGAWTSINDAPADTAFKSSINFKNNDVYKNGGADALKPVSHGTDKKWYTAVGALVDSYAPTVEENKDTYTALTDTQLNSGLNSFMSGYAYYTKLDVKALVDGTLDLYIKNISVTIPADGAGVAGSATTTAALNKALRIAVNVGNDWFYYVPARTGDDLAITFRQVASATTTANYTPATATTAVVNNLTTTPTTINFYIYFDGEDPACMTSYAVDLRTSTIAFELVAE